MLSLTHRVSRDLWTIQSITNRASFWQMLHSVVAAAFGVQSGKNRARDFTHGKPSHFVMLGILSPGCLP